MMALSIAERPVNMSLATTAPNLATIGNGAAVVLRVMPDFIGSFGERAGTRTQDLLIKSQLLYRLSYALPRWAVSRLVTGVRLPGQ